MMPEKLSPKRALNLIPFTTAFQRPAPSTQHSAPSTQHSAPSTQHSAPSTIFQSSTVDWPKIPGHLTAKFKTDSHPTHIGLPPSLRCKVTLIIPHLRPAGYNQSPKFGHPEVP
ncbi:hypothetical protein BC936DRAFT_148041 [Jimgerdemannia flammicorona]|uniref:Uncharacterized protein n=1 Tax=Jimgerdemannia flammicorona TaxID=994334 RepID=A0A433DL71_9FUNG|nr:hypothetical protein BC936DRAFT_148041 [Jimgerdemannia flammicorona]